MAPFEVQPEVSCRGGPRLPTVRDYKAVGEFVKNSREAAGLSLEEAATALTLALTLQRASECCRGDEYLRNLELGAAAPHPEHLASLERVLAITPGELHHAYGYLASDEVPPFGEEYVSLSEAARLLGLAKASVHHAITKGKLKACRLMPPAGRASLVLVIRRADLEGYEPRPYPRRTTTSGH